MAGGPERDIWRPAWVPAGGRRLPRRGEPPASGVGNRGQMHDGRRGFSLAAHPTRLPHAGYRRGAMAAVMAHGYFTVSSICAPCRGPHRRISLRSGRCSPPTRHHPASGGDCDAHFQLGVRPTGTLLEIAIRTMPLGGPRPYPPAAASARRRLAWPGSPFGTNGRAAPRHDGGPGRSRARALRTFSRVQRVARGYLAAAPRCRAWASASASPGASFSILTAHTLNSAVLVTGSPAELVSSLTGDSL